MELEYCKLMPSNSMGLDYVTDEPWSCDDSDCLDEILGMVEDEVAG